MGSEPPQDHELPNCMEAAVLKALRQRGRSREGWEELRSEGEPPMSDLQVFLENMIGEVERHGLILARLAVVPTTRKELQASARGAVGRIPAWMNAAVYGPPLMTPHLFLRGMAQLLGEQRKWFERVLQEQVADPEPIEEVLAEAPVPAGSEEEELAEITEGVGQAMAGHLRALLDIAHDLDNRLRALLGTGQQASDT
jgi:hypothetical protein